MDSTYPLVPVANFLASVLVLASLSKSMFQTWNVGVCSFAFWIITMGFTMAVNAIVWADNVENSAPVWCDIVIRLQIGSLSAFSAASFVIIRRLSLMLRLRSPTIEKERKLGLLVDLALCLGTPLALMPLAYLVQEGRFRIIEEYGCSSVGAPAGFTVMLSASFPIIFSVLSLTLYSPRIIYAYCQHRKLNAVLENGLLMHRQNVLKLMVLGLFDIFITLPITTLNLITTVLKHEGISTFWPKWKSTHANISAVSKITSTVWKSAGWTTILNIRFSQWLCPLFAVVFFILFGITEKNKIWYRDMFRTIMSPFRSKPRESVATPTFAGDPCSVPGSGANRVRTAYATSQLSDGNSVGRERFSEDVVVMEEAWRRSLGSQPTTNSLSLFWGSLENRDEGE